MTADFKKRQGKHVVNAFLKVFITLARCLETPSNIVASIVGALYRLTDCRAHRLTKRASSCTADTACCVCQTAASSRR